MQLHSGTGFVEWGHNKQHLIESTLCKYIRICKTIIDCETPDIINSI
jgi:hypothetical protein